MPQRLIADISSQELSNRLRRGAFLSIPPFVVRLETDNSVMTEALPRLYGNFDLLDREAVPDFIIRLGGAGGLRRWFRRQAMARIDTPPPYVPLPYRMAPLMFEQALNWCVATRTFTHLVMHAAVVARAGRAVIIPGETGQGKSTLCAALVSRGWQHLSDEFALIDTETRQVTAHPRPISLKNASLDAVRDWDDGLEPQAVMEGTPKGLVGYLPPTRAAIDAADKPLDVAAFVFPGFAHDAAPAIREISKGRAFIVLTSCCVNYRELGEVGFNALGAMVEKLPVYRSSYANTAASVALLESLDLGA